MRKKRIKTIVCVAAIATMLLSSMGIGVFAEVEQTAPTVQAQAEGDEGDANAVETPQADPQEPAAPAEGQKVEAKEGETGTLTVTPSKKTIKVNGTQKLTAMVSGGGSPMVTWATSDANIASVSPESGNIVTVTGNAPGKATITATASDQEATCEITVTDEEPPTDLPKYAFKSGVTRVRTVSGHQRIKVVWTPAQVTKTELELDEEGDPIYDIDTGAYKTKEIPINANRYYVLRSGTPSPYCTIDLNDNGTAIKSISGYAVDGSYQTSPYWTKEPAVAGVAGSELYLEDKDVGDGLMDNATKQFRGGEWSYQIIPEYVEGAEVTPCDSAMCATTAPDSCMRTSCVALKIKVKKNLKSHDKQHAKLSLKKGTTIYTCAFGYGRYQFIHNGNFYWLNRVGTKSHKTVYDKWHPYTDEEVLYFANGRTDGLSASSTGKMIWVNTYTQRIYVFSGSYGNWSIDNPGGWYVSTGKPATPTIRYIDPKSPVLDTGRIVGKCKTINKKVKKRHGIPCWNCFSTWNAIHGQKKSWSIKGVPKSNGCVRNTNAHAQYIYNTCPKKTRVLIF